MFARKSLGQNFLVDANALSRIEFFLRKNVPKKSIIVEIGPGKAALSNILLKLSPGRLLLIEKDVRLKGLLNEIAGSNKNVEVYIEDMRDFNWENLSNFYLCANIPYYVTGDVIELLIKLGNRFKMAFLMLQKEVADKLLSSVGSKKYSYLTVYARAFLEMRKLMDVSKNSFSPRPNVDSVFMSFRPKADIMPGRQYASRFLRNAFFARRKSLWNNLARVYNKELVSEMFAYFGFDKRIRPQAVDVGAYIRIAVFFQQREAI